MRENLTIITRIKKTIEYLDNIIDNFPKSEIVLRNELKSNSYKLLENSYYAKYSKDKYNFQMGMIVNINLIDYYLKLSVDKKIITYKKYLKIGKHLVEITKMIFGWIKNEESK